MFLKKKKKKKRDKPYRFWTPWGYIVYEDKNFIYGGGGGNYPFKKKMSELISGAYCGICMYVSHACSC